MIDHVSEVFGFVLQNGTIAEEILLHDEDEDGPLPGLTDEEREIIDSIEPHLEESWIGLLSACREALWKLGAGHHTAAAMRTRKTRNSTMYSNEEVHVPLFNDGRVATGVALKTWGADQFHVFVWVWTKKEHRKLAQEVVDGLDLPVWRNEYGSFLLTLATPVVGQSFEEIGRTTAEKLWTFAKPIADAVQQAENAP